MYASREKVKELVVIAQATGQLPVELCDIICKVVVGLIGRNNMSLDRQDMCQDAVALISTKIANINPEDNCFSYITTICFNCLRQAYRRNKMQGSIRERYAAHLRSTGGQVTDV